MSKDLDKTDPMNPCSECIVASMCKKECSGLVEYLVETLNYGEDNRRIVIGFKVAERLRSGEITLYNGDWKIIK